VISYESLYTNEREREIGRYHVEERRTNEEVCNILYPERENRACRSSRNGSAGRCAYGRGSGRTRGVSSRSGCSAVASRTGSGCRGGGDRKLKEFDFVRRSDGHKKLNWMSSRTSDRKRDREVQCICYSDACTCDAI
jgi:hypothetical protein